jgi:myo-inositol-1(or 4)-monophosphatase
MDLNFYLKIAVDSAKNAGAYLKAHFHSSHHLGTKSHINDLVTECDKGAEDMIKSYILSHCPESNFHCEESGIEIHGKDCTWIIDPLDGTVNFAKKIPFFCVSIALMMQNKIVVGVIYSPMTDELFTAILGQGSFLNSQKIQVSSETSLNKAFGATGFPYLVQNDVNKSLHPIENLLKLGVPLRRLGSAALDLAYTACGRFDIFFEAHLEPWDYAAGALILKEAHGNITDYQNKELSFKRSSSVCATNKHLHPHMIDKVLI